MGFIMHDEGELYLLKVAFSEEATVPASFYVGLCNDTLVEADGLADIQNEPSGSGYSRQAVASNSTDCVVTTSGIYGQVAMALQTFEASGGDWGTVNTWFIATTADNTGLLLCSGEIDPARVIGDGDSIGIAPTLRLRHENESE